MKIKDFDEFKKMSLAMVKDMPMDEIEDFVIKSGDATANFFMDHGNKIVDLVNDPRNKQIVKNFSVLFAYMCLDGNYSCQIRYFLNSVKKADLSNIPAERPKDWHINSSTAISRKKGLGWYSKESMKKRKKSRKKKSKKKGVKK